MDRDIHKTFKYLKQNMLIVCIIKKKVFMLTTLW